MYRDKRSAQHTTQLLLNYNQTEAIIANGSVNMWK